MCTPSFGGVLNRFATAADMKIAVTDNAEESEEPFLTRGRKIVNFTARGVPNAATRLRTIRRCEMR